MPGLMMRIAVIALAVLLLLLQFKLWFGSGGIRDVYHLERAVETQAEENRQLRERNLALEAEVADLKEGLESVEERARSELGMIRKGETFYQIIDSERGQQ